MVSEEQNSEMELASEDVPVPQVQPEVEAPEVVDGNDDAEDVPHKKVRRRKKALYAAILKQMEFYFSDSNLTKDRFIAGLIKISPDVPIETFLQFNRIRDITTDIKIIAKALQNSEMLQVSEDGTKVRRITPIVEKQNIDECTVYVQRLPLDADHDMLEKLFSKYGKVVYVSIPKFKLTHKIKGFAFIEFETPEEAEKCLEEFRAKGHELPSQTAPTEMMSITTFHEEEKQEKRNAKKNEVSNEEADKSFGSDKSKNKKKKKKKNRHSDLENSDTQSDSAKIKKKKESENNLDASISDSNVEVKEGKKQKSKIEDETNQSDSVKPRKRKDNIDSDSCLSDINAEVVEKKKRKIKHEIENSESEQSEIETKKMKENKDSDVCASDSNNENEEKRQKKRKNRKSLEVLNSDSDQQNAEENKKKQKKVKIEKLESVEKSDNNESDKAETSEDVKEALIEENASEKKKKRKRNRNNAMEETPLIGMQVMGKKEWKRLRNRYLDLQRAKMKQLKQHLRRAKWNQWGEKNKNDHDAQEATSQKPENPASKLEFSPGLIVKIELNEPCVDPKNFKAELRNTSNSIKYIDIKEGSTTAFVRCDTSESASALSEKSSEERRFAVLSGEEETSYWDKIKQDREFKIGSNIRTKQKGRKKLLKKAEKELGKHIKFED